ncbi:MAG: kelch repeat-containing protein, partial [Gaiellaceae bacterium]
MRATLAALLVVLPAGIAGAAGTWERHAPLPLARSEVAAALVGREIAVAGGYLADGGTSARVDAYSPAADRWRRLPSLPVAVNHPMAAAWRGRLYVLG